MARLDVRVKTMLDSRVIYTSRVEKVEESVVIQELSLSGALVSGLSSQLKEIFTIKPTLPGYGEVELSAKVIRPGKGGMAVRIFYSDNSTMQALWDHIKGKLILGHNCPYCDYTDPSQKGTCKKCDLYLNFSKDIYLERHVENTFAQRLSIRLSRLKLEHFHKIIQFVDSKLLKVRHRSPDKEFIGTSPGMLAVFAMIRKVAPTEMSVLLLGESGTGKELTAKALHTMSTRKYGPFVAINCAAIPESLLEAELFGYEKGAFTGAYAAKKGKFESADGGTLFLDEIGDLPSSLQAKLLRFLEDRLIERVGSSASRKIDVRIVAATNSDLQRSMAEERFRPDLFYRLNSFTIKLPPLRDRGEDRILLARHFLEKFSVNEQGQGPRDFTCEALEAIRWHAWPGNVRELENRVRRGFLMATRELVDPDSMELCDKYLSQQQPPPVKKSMPSRKEHVISVLEQNDYVIAKAARELNISRPSLYALIKKYRIAKDGV